MSRVFRLILSIIFILQLSACGEKPVGDFDLSAMTFNVRYPASSDTGDKAWDNRKSGIYAMLRTVKPMVVGVQECFLSQRHKAY